MLTANKQITAQQTNHANGKRINYRETNGHANSKRLNYGERTVMLTANE
jgi:hypothetical protein